MGKILQCVLYAWVQGPRMEKIIPKGDEESDICLMMEIYPVIVFFLVTSDLSGETYPHHPTLCPNISS
jgi:hypothetical protein